ncbi:MAG: carboxypeptidase regulatory-like domain-containing protein, partial [Vicinamibacteraceae bacterium]
MNRPWPLSTTSLTVPLAAIVLAAATAAHGQQGNTAIVVGLVTDQSDAPIPGATVTLTHLGTNTPTLVSTDGRGQYRTPPLRIGRYDVTIELEGFRRFHQREVVLSLGDVRTMNAALQVGALSEQTTVSGTVPLLDVADSTVGTVITNQQINDLPLNGRDYLQLASLSSGTSPTTDVGVSIGGQAGSQAAFLLDGQDNNSQQISNGHAGQKEVVKPSVDAIQELEVVTNGYAAEYGRSSSGVISVALKSGSNALHGTTYEFFRDAALDAKNYFAQDKPPFRRNQFGGTAGFPILRNRTFFFGDIERGTIRQSTTVVSTLPQPAVRAGRFPSPIVDPLTGRPFPGNRIPRSRIDRASAR